MTKMVQLADSAYERLRRAKRRGESFSDVVTRLLPEGSLLDLQGLRSGEEIDEAERMRREMDEMDREDAGRRMDEHGDS